MKNNKQDLYIFIIMIALIGLTIGYAALNSTLNINGKSSISKNTWDVYFDNVVVRDGSVEAVKTPTVIDKTTVDFEVALNMPGDFYEFTVDVVNSGTIDAMIESILKEPELNENQKKYLNYIIEYENGEQINSKQLLKVDNVVRIKVRIEIKKDIAASDLPEVGDTLYLGFTMNYIQANEEGILVNNNGINVLNVISGDLETIGSEVAIGDEHFYIVSSNESEIKLLTKYNLYVGGKYQGNWTAFGSEATGKQDSTMIATPSNSSYPRFGTIKFSTFQYWAPNIRTYPAYAYDSNAIPYEHVENYKTYLETHGISISQARLISLEELQELGCSTSSGNCSAAPSWVYSTSYWTGTAYDSSSVLRVYTSNFFGNGSFSDDSGWGVRPLIIIEK